MQQPMVPYAMPAPTWAPPPIEITPDTPLDDLISEYAQVKPLADSYAKHAAEYASRAADVRAALVAAVVREHTKDRAVAGLDQTQRELFGHLVGDLHNKS